jgi:DNA-binding transcriptional regulator PaaX
MSRNPTTSKIIDEILLFSVTGAAMAGSLLIPNLLIGLDKPLMKFWKHMDKRQKEHELQQIIYGMKSRGYLVGEYEHGLQLTEKARHRLQKIGFEALQATPHKRWDKLWRIVIYDIPEEHKAARNALTQKLRNYGCFQLQKSTWITPFPCREDIATITAHFGVDTYVTYFEAIHLDNAAPLIRRFRKKYPDTRFS